MDKILVNLIVPSISKKFEIFVPETINVERLTKLLSELISIITQNLYISSNAELLYLIEKKAILHQNCSLMEYRIEQGDHIIMF